jgi:hypothetical protein
MSRRTSGRSSSGRKEHAPLDDKTLHRDKPSPFEKASSDNRPPRYDKPHDDNPSPYGNPPPYGKPSPYGKYGKPSPYGKYGKPPYGQPYGYDYDSGEVLGVVLKKYVAVELLNALIIALGVVPSGKGKGKKGGKGGGDIYPYDGKAGYGGRRTMGRVRT